MMKKLYLLFLIIVATAQSQTFNYQREWATYFGEGNVFFKDATVDKGGNIYVVGTINYSPAGTSFVTTPEAHQMNYGGGASDGFIVKFNPSGTLEWVTYFGGELSDRIDGVAVDASGFYLYIIGSTFSTTGISTSGAFQSELSGDSDAFIAKISNAGNVEWCTYYGGNAADDLTTFEYGAIVYSTKGITISSGNVFVYSSSGSDNMATAGTFQTERQGSRSIISSFDIDGQLIWCTYYGNNLSEILAISANDNSIYVSGRDDNGCGGEARGTNYFATPGCHLDQAVGYCSIFLSKFDFEGQRLWSTYYGSSFDINLVISHAVKSTDDSVYLAGITNGASGIATIGAYQENSVDWNEGSVPFLVKFDENGIRQWGTYCGANQPFQFLENYNTSLNKDDYGNVYLNGSTSLRDNIATPGSYQEYIADEFYNNDNFVVKFNPQGERIWGTYYGGIKKEYNMITRFDRFGNMYFLGDTSSEDNIATPGSYQPDLFNNPNPLYPDAEPYNIYLAKFIPRVLETNDFTNNSFHIYPNPNNGNFSIATKEPNSNVEVVNALGQTVFHQQMNDSNVQINGLASGLYFVKVKSGNQDFKTEKMLVR